MRISSVVDVTVMKGAAISRYYPADIIRPVGDLDLYVRSEAALWAAARCVADEWRVEPTALTMIDGLASVDTMIAFDWPDNDPLIDSDIQVEIATFAYPGNQAEVPICAGLPAYAAIAQLILVAEESNQRPFTVKDALDCMAIFFAEPECLGEKGLRAIEETRRAPEVLRLIEHTTALFPKFSVTSRELATLSVAESARRHSMSVPTRIGQWSSSPGTTFGLYIGGCQGHQNRLARRGTTSGGYVICSSVGDFFMVPGAEVEQADADAAIERVAALHAEHEEEVV